MRFIDFFAGIGGFTRGLELAGHECIGHCEFDKFAEASYRSMHTITEEQRTRLSELNKKKRQKEILKSEYLNGEWYSNDVRAVNVSNIPRADCWTFGAPCQDFSIAGRRASTCIGSILVFQSSILVVYSTYKFDIIFSAISRDRKYRGSASSSIMSDNEYALPILRNIPS